MRILILCTGNSCRSQMAEGFLRNFDERLYVRSAGTKPSAAIHPKAALVMAEEGIDITLQEPDHVADFLDHEWDYVITVCEKAREDCPVFIGQVNRRFHIGFEDPAVVKGTDEEIMKVFRRVRDEIKDKFYKFYRKTIREY